jgi:hypothetical protein
MVHCSRLIHRTVGFVLYRGFQNRWPVRHSLLGDGGCRLSAASACRADPSGIAQRATPEALRRRMANQKNIFLRKANPIQNRI